LTMLIIILGTWCLLHHHWCPRNFNFLTFHFFFFLFLFL
jgi:hypothetical protein